MEYSLLLPVLVFFLLWIHQLFRAVAAERRISMAECKAEIWKQVAQKWERIAREYGHKDNNDSKL